MDNLLNDFKESPLLVYPAEVLAILGKQQTKRASIIGADFIINQEPDRYKSHGVGWAEKEHGALFEDLRPEITPWISPVPSPFGQIGDLLYIQERWRGKTWASDGGWGEIEYAATPGIIYSVNAPDVYFSEVFPSALPDAWRPAEEMPRWAARIFCEVDDLQVERLLSESSGEVSKHNPWMWVAEFHLHSSTRNRVF